jgi:hypothetical protein
VYPSGVDRKPDSGILIQATGTATYSLRALSEGSTVQFSIPSPAKYKLSTETIWGAGFLQKGSVKIAVSAVNFTGSVTSGVVLYDTKFSPLIKEKLLAATMVLDKTGKVIAFYPKAQSVVPTATKPFVVQVSAKALATIKAMSPKVGTKFTINNSYASQSGSSVISATGRNKILLSNSVNRIACTASSEQIRPRSVLGWNKYGDFWLVSSGMGKAYADNGLREGGSTIHQMGDWLKQLGATDAVSFDGGGSVTMFAKYSGSFKRIDLPANATLRNAPVGLVVVKQG